MPGLFFSGFVFGWLFQFRAFAAFRGRSISAGTITSGAIPLGTAIAAIGTRGWPHRQFIAIDLPVSVAIKPGKILLHAVGSFFQAQLAITVFVKLLEELLSEIAVVGPSPFRSTIRGPAGLTGPAFVHAITLRPSSVPRSAPEITGGRPHQLARIKLSVAVFVEFLEEIAGLGQLVARDSAVAIAV